MTIFTFIILIKQFLIFLRKKVFTYLYKDMKKTLDKKINKDKDKYRLTVKENLDKLKKELNT